LKRSHLAREIVETIALTILIFLAIHFTVQNYQIDGTSMTNTLQNGQFVLVNKVAYLFHAPERGDVIVCHEPDEPGRDVIKRIIGLPGDKITLNSTDVWVNGVKLNEPYIREKYNPRADTIIVQPDQYFVMGDHRQDSKDSRYFGQVPRDFIVGKAVFVYWPLNQWQMINTYSSVYSQIK
jgi:signal peptidase I